MSDFTSMEQEYSISKLCLSLPKKKMYLSSISLGKCAYSDILKKKIDV